MDNGKLLQYQQWQSNSKPDSAKDKDIDIENKIVSRRDLPRLQKKENALNAKVDRLLIKTKELEDKYKHSDDEDNSVLNPKLKSNNNLSINIE